jgi:ubiquinone/menaquinone biosynthesis C-methylase UbiE
MKANDDAFDAILTECQNAGRSPEIALMNLLIAAENAAVVQDVLSRRIGTSRYAGRIASVMEQNEEGCRRVADMLSSGVDSPPENGTIEEGIRFCRTLFDWSVQQSEEASVALYSFANPSLLREATREIEELFTAWGLVGADRTALDIGCGIGRLEQALAPRLSRIVAIDVSEAMIAAARRRCAELSNVAFQMCSGRDLGDYADGAFDLVFAVDSFPYLVQSGMALVDAHFAEAARVLTADGDFVILDFSYRQEHALDCQDVARLAASYRFDAVVLGSRPFSIWDGTAFHLRKAAD